MKGKLDDHGDHGDYDGGGESLSLNRIERYSIYPKKQKLSMHVSCVVYKQHFFF